MFPLKIKNRSSSDEVKGAGREGGGDGDLQWMIK